MKKLFLFIWILLLLFTMMFGVFLLTADRLYVEKYLAAKRGNTASLFQKANLKSSPKYQLQNGELVKYQFLSQTGKWTYVLYKDEVLTTRTNQLYTKYIKFKSTTVSTGKIYLALVVIFILFFITIFRVNRSTVKKLTTLLEEYVQKTNQLSNLNNQQQLSITRLDKCLIEKQKILNTTVDDCNSFKNKSALLINDNKKLHKLLTEKQKVLNAKIDDCKFLKNKSASLINNNKKLQEKVKSLKEDINKAESLKQKVVKKLKDELDEFYIKESSPIAHPSISDMKTSEARLITQLDKQVREGLIFGVDFKHERYESILKGRKFEIFIATWLTKELGFEIEEWSPDKGFDQEILVKSNLNPDLIISNSNGEKFGIECKYRSKHFKPNEANFSWGTVYQGNRYNKFQEDQGYPVYVCLGVFGTADNPESFSILPINKLISKSFKKKFSKNSSEQFVVSRTNIEVLDERNSARFSVLESTI